MDKEKQIIEDVEVEWTSADSSDSSSDDEEWVSTVRQSRFEHEIHQGRRGAETSNEAAERNRMATTSGEEILLIPPIARLTRPPRRLSVESFLRTLNPRSVLTEDDLSDIRGRYGFPNKVQLRLPLQGERADTVSEGWMCMYIIYFECGLRLPLHPLLIQCMHHYQLAIPQLMPNGMRVFLGLIVLADEAGVELSVDDMLAIYYPQENSKDHGRYSMYPRRKKQVVGEMKNADRYWQIHYFFMLANEKSMGGLANAFYPLWGSLRKELNKPPLKALLFEEKLERLLALPNREWDKIHGALRRLFGTPLFIEPLTGEEAWIVEFALDMMNIDFPSPKDLLAKRMAAKEAAKPVSSPAKKRKAVEKGKRKVPAKRNKRSKIATPETNVEPHASQPGNKQVEVDLSPSVSLLQDKETSVRIMRQLLSEVDSNILNEGRFQNHLDDLLWDGLKVNVRAMGLLHRTSDRVFQQKNQIKELESKDRERGEKLLDFERKFGDVKTSAEELTAELQRAIQTSKKGSDMMKIMVDRYDAAQAKIEALEAEKSKLVADNTALVVQIMDAFEKATLKARYDLLKEYKQGLLVDAEVDEEIELYEETPDEAGCSSAAPDEGTMPTSKEPIRAEPSVDVNPSEDRKMRK
ncbi:hypothetical protein TIFTF001_032051 [Ficus carica]|uniref:Transposase (putative) gypsy type domain-containing protein n=1 Tax=Ficus carica TaxID=3494 RepID=A0AA88J1X5_FICCA|nr:hypothetical protein TIFTF001_032051 [Ficus carica]